MEWQHKSCKSNPIPHLSSKADPTSSYLNNNQNNEHVTKGWNLCSKLEDCHCQAYSEKTLGLQLVFCNFRPVSNLSCLAKALEKCAPAQLDEHCKANAPIPDYPSAYMEHYICKTALAKLVNDLLWLVEEGCVTSFISINLLSAFDMVSHDILLDLLEVQYGVTGKVLSWFNSYLHPRNFKVNVNSDCSKPIKPEYSMPQGSCLGPVMYLLYASSLEEAIAPAEPPAPAPNDPEEKSPTAEKIDLHGYADDHGNKNKFEPVCDNDTVT